MRLPENLGASFAEKLKDQWESATSKGAQEKILEDLAKKIKEENPSLTPEQAALLAARSVTPTPPAATSLTKYAVPAVVGAGIIVLGFIAMRQLR